MMKLREFLKHFQNEAPDIEIVFVAGGILKFSGTKKRPDGVLQIKFEAGAPPKRARQIRVYTDKGL
jgi:hypothetical protein